MNVVAITSCATGIAHTYMAAEAIKKVCMEKGYSVRIEMQGAMGIEDRLTSQEIADADLIIFANDVRLTGEERFDDYLDKIKRLTPHKVIHNPNIIFERGEVK